MWKLWRNYRHRLVPWLIGNWRSRVIRQSDQGEGRVLAKCILTSLQQYSAALWKLEKEIDDCPNCCRDVCLFRSRGHGTALASQCRLYEKSGQALYDELGFELCVKASGIPAAGRGVYVQRGAVQKGQLVALYPGTVYQRFQPIFFQSIRNPFVLRCLDGILVDGNDQGLSAFIYRSCWRRDRFGPVHLCDSTWMTTHPINRLAVGQIVNNQSRDVLPNVTYQEADVSWEFPHTLRQYIPNVNYDPLPILDNGADKTRSWIRVVGLVALQDIEAGEELFSSYLTVVHGGKS